MQTTMGITEDDHNDKNRKMEVHINVVHIHFIVLAVILYIRY